MNLRTGIDVLTVESIQNDLEKIRAMARLLLEYYACKEPDIEDLSLHMETMYDMTDNLYNSVTNIVNDAIINRKG